MQTDRGSFGRLGFVLAAAGSAVGLGNIWKFPYITYANDGGSFVLIYLAAVLLIGAPIMVAEIVIGRKTQQSPVGAFLDLARGVFGGKLWAAVGWLGILGGFVILSYYAVVAGWTIFYVGKCLTWSFGGFGSEDAAALGDYFGAFLGNGTYQVIFHGVFMLLTMGVVILGVKSGIERVAKVLMPVLIAILALLVVNSFWAPGFGEAIRFLFHVGSISANGVLEAVGHSFFTLSLGMGAMITYGSYLGRKESIPRATATVCLFDTGIAIAACVVMFSIIFSVPEAGRTAFSKSSTILFTTLPRMFYDLPLGSLLAPLFYLLVAFAALTSTISLLEVVVAYFIDRRNWSRRRATAVVGTLIFLGGIPSALSLGAHDGLSTVGAGGFFSTADYVASNWMLPVGGFFIALFTGWFVAGALTREEIEAGHGPIRWFGLWKFLLRIVCPVAIAWIIYEVIGGRSFS